jgi:predicted peptidase
MRRLYNTLLIALAMISFQSTKAQDLSMYEKHWLVEGKDSLPYRLLLPKDYDETKEYPLLLFLHGAGERGNDNEKQLVHGAKLFLRADVREQFPAIVVFPQCSADGYWSNVKIYNDVEHLDKPFEFQKSGDITPDLQKVMHLMTYLKQTYKLDATRMYVAGLSMGGMGTFELVRRKPNTFAAAIPICGGANTVTAKKLVDTDWWIFHGLKDNVVNPEFSKEMATAIQQAGGTAKLTLYPEANHNSWDSAFAEAELLPWLFSHKK